MSQSDCRLLDDHLAGDLAEDAREGFESHLAECPVCRAELTLQRSIDATLRAGNNSVQPPPSLTAEVRQAIRSSQWRVLYSIAASAAAVLVLACATVAFWSWLGDDSEPLPRGGPQIAETSVPKESPTTVASGRSVTIAFPETRPAIATRLETEDPSVTIFMVYPVHTSASTNSF